MPKYEPPYHFSRLSEDALETCHPDIQVVCRELIKVVDFSVRDGWRGEELQMKYFAEGKSKLPWPLSKHNEVPSRAVHLLPHPFPGWESERDLIYFGGIVVGFALRLGVGLRWGGDWNGNRRTQDERGLRDLIHFELLGE